MLNQGFFEDRVAITSHDILPAFERVLEVGDMLRTDDSAKEHLGQQVVEDI